MLETIHDRDLGTRIGIVIRRRREHQGVTQAELAALSGVTQAEISLIERGKRSHLKTLDRVSQALETRLSDLIRFAEDIGSRESVVQEAREFVRRTRKSHKSR